MLKGYGVSDKVISGFEELITKLRIAAPMRSGPGLFDVPREPKTSEWDL